MANVIAKYKKSYHDIRASGAKIMMVPDKVETMECAMLTTMFNFVLAKSPGNIYFDVIEYDDGHKEYAYADAPEFKVHVMG